MGIFLIMDLENFKYNLSRLKKCDQYWEEMTPTEGGRICAGCRKKIVDFSHMSFTEIAIYMSESREPVCGFYKPEQIKKTYLPKSRLPLAVGLSAILTTPLTIRGKETGITVTQNSNTEKTAMPISLSIADKDQDTVFVTGQVLYYDSIKQKNFPVSYASVLVRGTRMGVVTDADGQFRLAYVPDAGKGKLYLDITSIGFRRKEIIIDRVQQTEIGLGAIMLERYTAPETEFIVSVKRRSKLSRFWRKITKPFRRKR